MDPSKEFVKVTKKPDTITGKPTVTTGYAGDSQYVNIAFNGTVGNGESIEIELTADVTDAVTNFGSEIWNFAFTTSKEVGVATSDNTTGAVIKDDEGLWASELVNIATALHCPEERAQALKTALGTQGTYGYLGDFHENTWATDNQLVCVKAEYGPSDGGVYRTDKVALLTNDEHDAQRTMHYQLTINNVSEAKRTNMAVMDIMPAVGDQRINNTDRGSNWDLYFNELGTVTVNGKKCTDYTVYYFEGDATQFDADTITDIVNESKRGCPAGWRTDKPAKPTAFIVAFAYDPSDETAVTDDKTVVLEGNKSVQIEYTAKIDYIANPEDLNKIVFTNAANDFNFGYSTFSPPSTADKAKEYDPLGSNVVEVTIAPPKVKVGGDVWIDADSDGWQNDGEQSWYLSFDVVKQLLKDLNVKLNTSNQRNFAVTDVTQGTIKQTGSDPDNYGIAHFEFDDLTAAKLRSKSTDLDDLKNWINDKSGDEAGKLIGKNPYTYNMNMVYSGSTFTKTKNNVDPRGSYIPGKIPDDDQKDDNFVTRRGNYQTEQFFLHQTADVFDMTKDNGYNLLRSLKLTKVSQSSGEALEGAEFTIYGPFDHGTGTKASKKLSDDDIVAKLTTDSDGKISKDDLFFFKEYVIVETKPADGHSIEGAKAEGTNITKLGEGKWLLKVPAADYVPSGDEITDQVIVRDPGNIEVEVDKIWDDDEDAYGTRPESIQATIYTDEACTKQAKYADGKVAESKTLDAGNDWKAVWKELPRYQAVEGAEAEEITYYVKETDSQGRELSGYNVRTKSVKDKDNGNQKLTITNTPISTSLEVKKNWEDTDDLAAQVKAVTFRVEQSSDGETWTPATVKGKEITLTIERKQGEKMGTATKDGLPAYDAGNKPLTYRAVEISITIDGKTLEVKDGKVGPYEVTEAHMPGEDESAENATATDLSEITNTMIPTKFSVEKSFVDDTFDFNKNIKSITVMLQRKSGEADWDDVETFDLTAHGDWKHTWTGLQKLDGEGNAYEYRAIEVSYTTKQGQTVAVDYESGDKTTGTIGAFTYTSSTEGTEEEGFTTYIENRPLKGSLEVSKVWKGRDGAKVPDSLTISLKAVVNGKEVNLRGIPKSVELNKANGWTDDTTWAELPVYYTDGSKISYLLTEAGKGKYTAAYKVYYDDNVIRKGAGKSLSVNVYANDTVEAEYTNTLTPPPTRTRTGDNTPFLPFLLSAQISLAVLLLLIYRRRRAVS